MRHVATSSLFPPARRMGWAVVLIAMLAVMVSGQLPTTLAHEPNELDQQYTLSQASTQQQYAQVGNPTGATFGDNMAVLVCAVFSNPCRAQAGIEVTFTAEPSSGGASGTFSTTETGTATAVSGSNGIATAPSFRTNAIAGSYTVRVVASEPTPPPRGAHLLLLHQYDRQPGRVGDDY